MKHYKKTMTMLLTAAVLLVSVFMTGCTSLTEPKNNTPSGTDAPAESDGFGVYVKLERDDASSIALHGGSSFTKVCENADTGQFGLCVCRLSVFVRLKEHYADFRNIEQNLKENRL